MAIGDEYVETVRKWEIPKTTKEVERFLGFTNYHKTFIKDYAKKSSPLTRFTGRKRILGDQNNKILLIV